MALNEAAKRAVDAKLEAKEEISQLTARQKAALKVQEEYLKRIVKNS